MTRRGPVTPPKQQPKPEQRKQLTHQKPSHVESLRVPPHSIDSEQALLGGLMLDETSVLKVIDFIEEEDFYRKDHRLVFRAIVELHNQSKPYDAVTLGEWFEANALTEMVGGVAYVIELANSTPSAANITAYAEIVKEKAKLRKLIDAGTEIANEAWQPRADASRIASVATSKLNSLVGDSRGGGLEPINSAIKSWMASLQKRYDGGEQLTGLETPFGRLNDLTQGLQAGDTIVIAGRPSMGKTVLWENCGRFNALKGEATALFSLEMRKESIIQRGISAMTGIPHERMRRAWQLSEDDFQAIMHATLRLNKAPYHIDDQPGLTPRQIVARALRQHMRNPLKMVGIDNLSRIQLPGRGNKADEIGDAIKIVQEAGKKYGWAVVWLVHLNRPERGRTNHRPTMNDLRGSGEIEQDADAVLFLHREDYYAPDTHLKRVVELIPAKGRDLNLESLPRPEPGMQPCVLLENHYSTMNLTDWVGDLPSAPEALPKRTRALKANGAPQAAIPYKD